MVGHDWAYCGLNPLNLVKEVASKGPKTVENGKMEVAGEKNGVIGVENSLGGKNHGRNISPAAAGDGAGAGDELAREDAGQSNQGPMWSTRS